MCNNVRPSATDRTVDRHTLGERGAVRCPAHHEMHRLNLYHIARSYNLQLYLTNFDYEIKEFLDGRILVFFDFMDYFYTIAVYCVFCVVD